MKYKNAQLAAMLDSLEPLMKRKDSIGYIAARNARIISDALREYFDFRNELVRKYGEEDFAGPIAKKIVLRRQEKPIETTFELAEIIKSSIPAKNRKACCFF